MNGPAEDGLPPADHFEEWTPTARDIARRHWLDLADPDRAPSTETLEWVRRVALAMISADVKSPKAADRREAIFEASGLKGDAYDGFLPVLLIALRDYVRLRDAASPRVAGMSAAEYVTKGFEWDPEHEVAPDSHKRRISRALDRLKDPIEREWARGVLNLK